MKKKKIYFAGKIKKNEVEEMWSNYYFDWRKSIVDFGDIHKYYVDHTELDDFIYTWPKYYREHWYIYEWIEDHRECFEECKLAIIESNIMFVYLDEMDSYWTMAEIWFAYANWTEVIIYYTNNVNEKELWFVLQFATEAKKVKNYIDAREQAKKYIRGDLKKMPYNEYLQTEHWKEISNKRKHMDWNKCVLCGSESKLNAHHRSYKNKGTVDEINDLITLCNNCHSKFHNK